MPALEELCLLGHTACPATKEADSAQECVCVCTGHCPSPGGGEEACLGSALRRREGGRQEEYWVCRVTSTWGLAPTLMLAPVSVHTGKRDRVRRFGANLIHHDPEASAGPGRGHREMQWGEESADGW